jgi:hypothetical protein
MLTETAIRHAKPKQKPYRLFDERACSFFSWFLRAAGSGAFGIATEEKRSCSRSAPTQTCPCGVRGRSATKRAGCYPMELIRALSVKRRRPNWAIPLKSLPANG